MSREDVHATYRVQLHKNFTLDDAAALIDYLADLGISHLYCSPYLQARPGSTHGYDVVNHRRINNELGGEAGLERLITRLREFGMGHILDVVPNHMTIAERANEWWWDVLKNGPYSDYAGFFDIDWDPAEDRLRRNILIPVLGDHYGRVLDKHEIVFAREDGEPVVRYYEHVLPVNPDSITYCIGEGISYEEAEARFNEDVESLHALLELQHYRLAYWRVAGKELNYRRFFAINDLAALRVDNPEVFDRVHELVLEMVRDGRLQGLRIDHIDGLRFPSSYLNRLREEAPDTYLVVEKILEGDEELPAWPIEGTTGYEFATRIGELFVDPSGLQPLTEFYERFTSESTDVETERRNKKMLMIETEFGGEIERLTDLFLSVCERQRQFRDYTRAELRALLSEVAASFPVYRTYVDPDSPVSDQDEKYVMEAIAAARSSRPDLEGELFELLTEILLLRVEGAEAEALALRFQQTTGPVFAKGIEDTLFYTFNRLVSLNEVGGDPGEFGISLDRFHGHNRKAQERWPLTMLASSTHDTKRSEDVRARINLLSEIPDRWIEAVTRWSEMNERHKHEGLPDRNTEYLLYQTLVGAWPLTVERATTFVQKAIREAKLHTSWLDRRSNYEASVKGFTERVIGDSAFQNDLETFVEPLIEAGYVSSLAQTLIKLTAPGIPDFYQGTELWDLSLVDPDNRRAVDYHRRRTLLSEAEALDAGAAWNAKASGLAKLWLIRRCLRLRRERPELFGRNSSYAPLDARGEHAERVVSFMRGDQLVAIAPRLVMGLGPDHRQWGDTQLSLPPGTWTDVVGANEHQGTASLADLLQGFPVALLIRD